MKKIFTLFVAAMTVFALAACDPDTPNTPDNPDTPENPDTPDNPDNPDTPDNPDPGTTDIPTLTLSMANVDVTGIDGDYLAVVDNAAKTIKIALEYVDKENVKALMVTFINLPQDFTTEYQKTFNYSDGATQTVVFKYKDVKAAEYVMSVSLGAPDPKFLTLTVAGVDAMSGEVHLSNAAALSQLPVEFTVEPEDAVVSVGGEAIESGATLDFSDKLNGVTFTLTCAEVTKTHKVVAVTSGLRKAERVWGHYVSGIDGWYGTAVRDIPDNYWHRTCAMDNDYVYLAQHGGAVKGAYVLSFTDGSVVGTLKTDGISGGAHTVSCIRTIPDGDGGYKILQCNLLNGNGSTLKVYKWDSKDSDPVTVLSYQLDGRWGDKMSVSGTWKDGAIYFVSGTQGDTKDAYIFSVKNGEVSSNPTKITIPGVDAVATYSECFKFSDTDFVLSACGGRPVLYSWTNNSLTKSLVFDSQIFSGYDEGIQVFTFNDQKYMALARLSDGETGATLRIIPLVGETLKSAIEAVDPNKVFTYGLVDPDDYKATGFKSGNALADCTLRVINGETYIAAMSEGAGISLFKLVE